MPRNVTISRTTRRSFTAAELRAIRIATKRQDDMFKSIGASDGVRKTLRRDLIDDAYSLHRNMGVRVTVRRLEGGKIGRMGRPIRRD